MKCNRCQQDSGSAGLINGLCHTCFWNPPPALYNYKCPDCKGEFQYATVITTPGNTSPTYKCPFCGRIMGGM